MVKQAIEKLDRELKEFKSADKKAMAVKDAVADALKLFCEQNAEFAQAVVQNSKTLRACCTEIMQDAGSSISDLEVYKRAVKFYFSTADIQCKMTINLCGDLDAGKPAGKVIELSFDDLFGGD